MSKSTIYKENGFENRADYLENLADESGIDSSIVMAMSDILGEDEDFDGLTSALDGIGF